MRPLPIHTPSLATFDDLKSLFVVREQLLADVVERVRAASTTAGRNHTLLVGPRGSGKTHLVSLAYHSVVQLRNDRAVSVQTCWLPEDPWAITSYRRLLDSILEHLDQLPQDIDHPGTVDEIEALLGRRCGELGPVVCFVENLDQILDAIGTDGQQRLRHLAQQRVLLFVASTTTLSRDLATQPAPFYGFFTTTRLEPFTVEQAVCMLAAIANHQGEEAAANYLRTDEAAGRLRAVTHLAGGQPRIWALLAQALTVAGLEQLVTLFLTRFDELTPYYQEQLARLSPQQRAIVVTLVDLDHPASVKELAEATEIDQRSLAKTMVELRERGWVAETASPLTRLLDQRRTYYELGEPLVRLAFQLKASRGSPVQLIVEFLKNWFDPSDLAEGPLTGDKLAMAYLQQAKTGQESDAILALTRRLYALPSSRIPLLDLIGRLDDACAQLLDGNPEPLLQMPSALRSAIEAKLPSDAAEPSAVHAIRIQLHREALAEFGFFPHPTGERWLERAQTLITGPETAGSGSAMLADWFGRSWQFEQAEEVLAETGRHHDPAVTLIARVNLATSYLSAGRVDEAVAIEEQVVAESERLLGAEHPATITVRGNLAAAYRWAGRVDEAIAIGEQVLADRERLQGPEHPDTYTLTARGNLALAYWSAGRVDEAIAIEEQVLADRERLQGPEHPDTITARANLSASYRSAGRVDEAIAIEVQVLADRERLQGPEHPDTITARANLAFSYWSAGRVDEAIAIGEQVLAESEGLLGAAHLTTLTARANLAASYRSAERIDEAVAIQE